MELKKIKSQLVTAVRGHKLLKDKSDEMIRQFSILLHKNKSLREEVEKDLSTLLKQFSVASTLTSDSDIEQAFSMPTVKIELICESDNIMGVDVQKLTVNENKSSERYPYSFAKITSEADYSVTLLMNVLPRLVELAQVEKSTRLLAAEIEKNKRRVNALEYVMIPQLEETIRYIRLKLDENERSSFTRLMKIKSMLENR
jgi:V/A-type H+-transporting ATPase subunit D